MTTVSIQCKHNEENKVMDFEIRLAQDENVCNEEKSAAMFLVPYIQKALELAMKDAESKSGGELKDAGEVPAEESELTKPLDGGPTIVTLD
jgi:hypothetical protein